MNRIALIVAALVAVILAVVLVRRDAGERTPGPDTVQIDTTPVNFDSLQANVPPPAPDTFTAPPQPEPEPEVRPPARIPPAPEALMDAVRREQSFTQFCYQEYGQKADPALRGGVAVIVTVGASGVTEARVANDNWTSQFGRAVNRCINERAAEAWRVPAGAVRPGRYQVDLTFRPA
jgi:hypothetical protein